MYITIVIMREPKHMPQYLNTTKCKKYLVHSVPLTMMYSFYIVNVFNLDFY